MMIDEIATGVLANAISALGPRLWTAVVAASGRRESEDLAIALVRYLSTDCRAIWSSLGVTQEIL